MKFINFAFLMLLLCQSAFSQSKKEQIETLIFQKDSLVLVLKMERQLNSDQVKQFETKISKINFDIALIQKELAQSKEELTEKEEKLSLYPMENILLGDTIRSLRKELHQLKASKFETFLPYFILQAGLGKNFDDFVDKENLEYGAFYARGSPGLSCLYYSNGLNEIDFPGAFSMSSYDNNYFQYPSWTLTPNETPNKEQFVEQISNLPYFPNQKPKEGECDDYEINMIGPDGIYYYQHEYPYLKVTYDDMNGSPIFDEPNKFKNLKRMRVIIQLSHQIIKSYTFVEFNQQWYLLALDLCDSDCGF